MRISRSMSMMLLAAQLFLGGWSGLGWAQERALDRNIALYQQLLRRNPLNARAYYGLGDAYSRKARENGDTTYFRLAEEALRKVLQIQPQYSEARRHLAFVLYARHDFAGAAQEAERAIALHPTDSHAYGVLGDAYLEVGKYAQARETYQKMIDLQQDLYAYSRLAGLKSLAGDSAGALAALHQALEAGQTSGSPQEHMAWVQWQLGNEFFALGNLTDAEASYQLARTTYPNYYRALAGLAQIQVAHQRYPEAIALYQQALSVIPLPEYAAALGDVLTKVGHHEDATKQYALVEYIGHLTTLNQVLYNRELATFYVDHDVKLTEGLALARKELEVRQDIYAYDLLAWALYKNGHPQEAQAAIMEALKLGTQDARLFFHAGMIHARLGALAQATTYLRQALATNPHFHLFHADVAKQTLREIEERFTQTVQQGTDHGQ
jgi:tetratricopeptide (TPR) repeat protein